MTRTIAVKILVLVIFIVVVCLPEFWTLYRESQIKLLCLPCERDKRGRRTDDSSADAEMRRKRSRDLPRIPGGESRREACNETDADGGPAADDARASCYTCETLGSGPQLQSDNRSTSAKVHIEMSVKLPVGDANFLKLAFYGHQTSSWLHLWPPDDETDDGGQAAASSCCRPAPSDRVVCLLRLSNRTIWSAARNEKFLQTQGGRKDTEISILKGRNSHHHEPRPTCSGLPSIEEIEVAANLHHRPTVSFAHRGAELLIDRTQL
ncbi:uncharacterized protein LOC133477024 isoform X3 [Phyllopteryx taeniolatus]|uniref:uncharacterized protein LOC133477024 isoform X3 n=1 Tax=Phyllopteryx taeniolatus TaxID=161469 RepID=UPI002AD58FB9|nr:uncharacterized protein LOC133477024 isoform X3 [Phyllopteryx taeniolatus]